MIAQDRSGIANKHRVDLRSSAQGKSPTSILGALPTLSSVDLSRRTSFGYALHFAKQERGVNMPKKASTKRSTLSEQLKELIDDSGLSRYRISMESGVAQSTLSSFMSGRRSMSLENIDRIGEVLGLELIRRKTTKEVRK